MYRERQTVDSSDSESDIVASMSLRHQYPQNSPHAPRDRASAIGNDSEAPVSNVDDRVEDMVVRNQVTPMVADQESEDSAEDEAQTASSDVATARSTSHGSPTRTDCVTVADDQVLNGHRSASAEDLYPS